MRENENIDDINNKNKNYQQKSILNTPNRKQKKIKITLYFFIFMFGNIR